MCRTGVWWPAHLCFAKDRLYLFEDADYYDEQGEAEGEEDLYGKRIFVLSQQGDTLYTYAHPYGHFLWSICDFDGKLLVLNSCVLGTSCVLALQGA